MENLLAYLLKSFLISGVMMTYYCLFLRNRKMNSFNRYYLLISLVCSLTMPWFNFSFSIEDDHESALYSFSSLIHSGIERTSVTHGSTTYAVSLVCLLVSVVLLSILFAKLAWIYKIKKTHPVEQMGNIHFVQTELEQAPFSFFNNLFWKKDIALDDADAQKIFSHEIAHIRQHHSVDKLGSQIIVWNYASDIF